jgi:hypothetical protein
MAISVKKVQLLRRQLQNRPGSLAESLKPFAEGKVNLQVIMGYVYQKDRRHAEVEVLGPSSKGSASAAAKGKFEKTRHIHCLIVQGDDRPGLGYAIARALGSSRINMSFALMQVVGRRYSGVFGFETGAAATRAMKVIKLASASRKTKTRTHRTTRRVKNTRKKKGGARRRRR